MFFGLCFKTFFLSVFVLLCCSMWWLLQAKHYKDRIISYQVQMFMLCVSVGPPMDTVVDHVLTWNDEHISA